ncbi:MBL fold metallo-hydrolase [Myxococcota bacterium]|nr:MBL fold metallo-hydrolase [Myxococcota bacterium]
MELPIRMPGLGHVNCYAMLDDEGCAVVDPGLPGPSTWRALKDRLGQAGLAPRHIHTVVVTHSHPDHFGGANRIAKESGAKILAHRNFSFGPPSPTHGESEVSVEDLQAQRDSEKGGASETGPSREGVAHAHVSSGEARQRRTPWGGEHPKAGFRTRVKWAAMRWLGSGPIPRITDTVDHGDVVRFASREWFVVHTPGHTMDHFCLHDPEGGLFLAGDHVLPSITPHISGISSSRDPLDAFFQSLDLVAEIPDVRQVLPAHGHPFSDLAARTDAIKGHHVERLDKVKSIGRALGPSRVESYTRHLFSRRSWGPMADSETYAHLEHLRIAGDAARTIAGDGSFLYETG